MKAATIVVPHMANAGSVDTNTVPAKAIARADAIDAEAKLTLDNEVPSVDIAVSTTNEANHTSDAARLAAADADLAA